MLRNAGTSLFVCVCVCLDLGIYSIKSRPGTALAYVEPMVAMGPG